MDTLVKVQQKDQGVSDKSIISISSDILIMMKSEQEFGSFLLDGDDSKGYLIVGTHVDISALIHNCFNARETGIVYTFTIDDVTISFR